MTNDGKWTKIKKIEVETNLACSTLSNDHQKIFLPVHKIQHQKW